MTSSRLPLFVLASLLGACVATEPTTFTDVHASFYLPQVSGAVFVEITIHRTSDDLLVYDSGIVPTVVGANRFASLEREVPLEPLTSYYFDGSAFASADSSSLIMQAETILKATSAAGVRSQVLLLMEGGTDEGGEGGSLVDMNGSFSPCPGTSPTSGYFQFTISQGVGDSSSLVYYSGMQPATPDGNGQLAREEMVEMPVSTTLEIEMQVFATEDPGSIMGTAVRAFVTNQAGDPAQEIDINSGPSHCP